STACACANAPAPSRKKDTPVARRLGLEYRMKLLPWRCWSGRKTMPAQPNLSRAPGPAGCVELYLTTREMGILDAEDFFSAERIPVIRVPPRSIAQQCVSNMR